MTTPNKETRNLISKHRSYLLTGNEADRINVEGWDFSDIYFNNIDFRRATFYNCDFRGCIFEKCDMRGTEFIECQMEFVDYK